MPISLTIIKKAKTIKLLALSLITNIDANNIKRLTLHIVMNYRQILVNSCKRCILDQHQSNIPSEMLCQISYKITSDKKLSRIIVDM